MRIRITVPVYDSGESAEDPHGFDRVRVSEVRELHVSAPNWMDAHAILYRAGINYIDYEEVKI